MTDTPDVEQYVTVKRDDWIALIEACNAVIEESNRGLAPQAMTVVESYNWKMQRIRQLLQPAFENVAGRGRYG